MANDKVLGETKRVLEMMEESEEKVSFLNQDLKQNEILCLQIKQNIKELRELNNKNSADLEDNQNLKTNIKKYNTDLVHFAQQIYSCGQELYADLNLRENELDQIEELLNKSEEKFLFKLNDHKKEEERLSAELELMIQDEIKENERKELEFRTLEAENEELQQELVKLSMEISKYENYIKQDEQLDKQESEYRNEIARVEEYIKSINIEINTISELLEILERDNQTSTAVTEGHISEFEQQLEELQYEIIVATKILKENKIQIEELDNKIKCIEEENRTKEDNYNQYNMDLNDIETDMKKTKENMQNEIDYCEKSTLEYEEMFKIQKELNEKLKREIASFKIKIEIQDAENNQITMDIQNFEERRSKLDLKNELETKQNELKKLKATRQDLKERYNKKYLEIQNEIKHIQEEIDKIVTRNKNLQDDIDTVILEIKDLKNNEEERIREKQNQAAKSIELDNHIQNLTFEKARVKAELIKNKQKTADSTILATPKHFLTPSSSNRGKKVKVHRHWDSDSSIEGEDRKFSELAKQKIKMKRLQGNKS
ncbi:hypothetical protein NQ314_001884 [Rhamnusium bicolor]|uniref:PRD domain-containing protein n=1 Tax=Rhamnusium bicolor TaxID=1586634 RepID=A0AAV8ZRV3_9CUCU|nr:hypothetical protein NQ314_001884 [Rhamnusium bicolor]